MPSFCYKTSYDGLRRDFCFYFSLQVAEERLGNMRTVRAFAQESKEQKLYNSRISHVLDLSYKESLARGIFWASVSQPCKFIYVLSQASVFLMQYCTLPFLINVHVRLFIFRKNPSLYGLIGVCTFIDLAENIHPIHIIWVYML